ncbi:hypothetical protein [Fulvivirga sedimenti]|uniref:Intradiol ring-cleavage dioxygenases domain-containing protein n=1 Tax=Fulvivirga sedimenti TaxID=2879465 RepID=A0A9X1HUQ9_9BACT|nr:hypothetical protein [Fulvivirga sedimenti]MCA6075118.1 hypothetical protein [Fulvivirga sedimenti]MCA6076295.1 hypothetical protein [Fulvivirga sedimenti]MCA6077423.1 hypothetical protein [Fulvivirga sedimenti]
MAKSNRRKFIIGTAGILGTTVLGTWLLRRPILRQLMKGDFNPELLTSAPGEEDYCILTVQQTEGPFFFPSPARSDIREDRKGKELQLKFQIVNHPDCTPVEGANVEIWHCDAEGTYSGYPEEITHDEWASAMFLLNNSETMDDKMHVNPVNENKFLRGRQQSDSNGEVAFTTIFPGWYVGRVPHIHVKITTRENREVLSQFYFDTNLCDEIYTSIEPYSQYGKCPLKIENDGVLASTENAFGLMFSIAPNENQVLSTVTKIGIVNS